MCAHPVNGEIKTAADAAGVDPLLRDLLYFDMLKRGFYLARRGFIALSLAIGDDEIRRFEAAVSDVLEERADFFASARTSTPARRPPSEPSR
jgi:glutamate-1-semialdehyde 2,1-aminomutase